MTIESFQDTLFEDPVGLRFRHAREKARWSLESVAQQLKLPVAVPHSELSAAALRGVIESFVLREGTDYGERDVPHEAKVAQVLRQLERDQHPLGDGLVIARQAQRRVVGDKAVQRPGGGNLVVCAKCNTKQPGGKFCAECGNALAQAKKWCTGCGQELVGAAKFCAGCGTPANAPAAARPA